MSKNEMFDNADTLSVACTHPTTPASGGPCRVGALVGVALTDERSDGTTTVAFRGVHNLSVKGVDGGGNAAIAVGDTVFYTDADTPPLSKKTSGAFKTGIALAAVTSGATTTIPVRLNGTAD